MATILLHFLKRLFSASTPDDGPLQQPGSHLTSSGSDNAFIYCLVGNVNERLPDGSLGKIVKGTKHFSPGTKVYCFPAMWGDGYKKIKVIGRHRKSSRLVTMIIPSLHIINWRLKKVYDPFIIKQMRKNGGWTSGERDKEKILEMLHSLNSH